MIDRCAQAHERGERCVLPAGHEGNHRLPAAHRCHARNCATRCRPTYLLCPAHWRLVPRPIQSAVYATYRNGQCGDIPSEAWHQAADAAIGFVSALEDHPLRMVEVNALVALGYGVREQDGRLMIEPKKKTARAS